MRKMEEMKERKKKKEDRGFLQIYIQTSVHNFVNVN